MDEGKAGVTEACLRAAFRCAQRQLMKRQGTHCDERRCRVRSIGGTPARKTAVMYFSSVVSAASYSATASYSAATSASTADSERTTDVRPTSYGSHKRPLEALVARLDTHIILLSLSVRVASLWKRRRYFVEQRRDRENKLQPR